MGNLSVEQLQIIRNLNNLPVDQDCKNGCGLSCRLATSAAANALDGSFEFPRGFDINCVNANVVLMTLNTLQDLSQG